ncbi:ATP-dependent RNA helicase RhlB [Oceanospirillum sanctuarii]|uniref:ATP-dependent RNA helicase RhlB n=1 Tax=Oceanospirillum sanctuarii TaxID=1434821 RepID=UPI000A39F3DA|nr:ATP-dependent RNA helicase RhlB [Oceanospirillum sanctuarii]
MSNPSENQKPSASTNDKQRNESNSQSANAKRSHKRRRRPPFKKKKPSSNWDIAQFVVPEVEGQHRFHDFDLPLPLMRSIHEAGFEYCTPIQGQSLEHTLLGKDLIGKAQTGTGKTAAFLISILSYFLEEEAPGLQKNGAPRALIIAPTRELVMQIAKDAHQLNKYCGFNVVSIVGGMDYQKQREQLKGQIDIMVATPGRLLDFHQKRDLDLREVEVLVLDEADRMLSMGFIPDVKRIIRATPKKEERQTFLFSATYPQDVENLAAMWTHEPVRIEIESEEETNVNVEQHAYIVADSDKEKLLISLMRKEGWDRVIVFANRRDRVRDLCDQLKKAGVSVAMLSGEVEQRKRIATLEKFRDGSIQVLVATDVAGRGIHIDDVSHVVNFTLPDDPEDYVHRIGRTGRAGSLGVSISFIGEEDAFVLPDIEEFIGKKIESQQPDISLIDID